MSVKKSFDYMKAKHFADINLICKLNWMLYETLTQHKQQPISHIYIDTSSIMRYSKCLEIFVTDVYI